MSINEIVNYVNKTPHNTNPSVVASMVRSSNNQAVYESVEELKRSGSVGHTETPSPILFSGDFTGKETVDVGDGKGFVKVTDHAIDLYTVKEIEVYSSLDGESVTVSDLTVIENVNGCSYNGLQQTDVNSNIILSVFEDTSDSGITLTKGTWFLGSSVMGGWVSRISFAETVHTIDPKYLPEEAIPKIIDFDTYREGDMSLTMVLLSLFAEGGGEISVKDHGLFDDLNTTRPIQVKFTFDPEAAVNVTGVTLIKNSAGGVSQLCFECIINHVNSGAVYRVAVMIINYTHTEQGGMHITLKASTI